ncbi:MAG: sigma-70 family RNA polymerase sigma factor [Pseudomonadota bacterium]
MSSAQSADNTLSNNSALEARLSHCLLAMAGGDEKALGDFYDATLARVYGVAIRIIGEASLAEDIVGDTYHEAWKRASSYQSSRGSVLAWLLTMCRNKALDCYRREASLNRTKAAAAEQPISLVEDEPGDLLQSIEEDQALHALLASLSGEERQLIALAYFRGFTHQQIAETTAMPLGTVKSKIRRALASLSDAMPNDLRDR